MDIYLYPVKENNDIILSDPTILRNQAKQEESESYPIYSLSQGQGRIARFLINERYEVNVLLPIIKARAKLFDFGDFFDEKYEIKTDRHLSKREIEELFLILELAGD